MASTTPSCEYHNEEYTNTIIRNFTGSEDSALEFEESTDITLNQEPSESLTLKVSIKKDTPCIKYDNYFELTIYDYTLNLAFHNHIHCVSEEFQDFRYTYKIAFSALVESLDNGYSFHIPLFSHTATRITQTLTFPKQKFYTENFGPISEQPSPKRRKIESSTSTTRRGLNFKLIHVCCTLHRYSTKTNILPVQSRAEKIISVINLLPQNDDKSKMILTTLLRSYITGEHRNMMKNSSHKLYEVAEYCNIPFLKKQCLEYIMFNMNAQNIKGTIDLATKYNLQALSKFINAFLAATEKRILELQEYTAVAAKKS